MSKPWTCPECARSFARRNQKHVCGQVEVEHHLEGKPDRTVALFHRFVTLVQACGPFEYSPTKTTVGFRGTRRIFAGARPTATALHGYLDLAQKVEDPRFRTVEPYTKRLFVHHFDIGAEAELDARFAGWVAEAYGVGEGDHLRD